jgi:hypothetical protein
VLHLSGATLFPGRGREESCAALRVLAISGSRVGVLLRKRMGNRWKAARSPGLARTLALPVALRGGWSWD